MDRAPAALLLAHAEGGKLDVETLLRATPQVARYGEPAQIARLAQIAQGSLAANPRAQGDVFYLVQSALTQRGESLDKHAAVREWFDKLGPKLLAELETSRVSWTATCRCRRR